MGIEPSPTVSAAPRHLEDRARVLRAMGDPTRLAILDALTLGDTAPDALSAELGIKGNLLAHHLKVLETAGLIGDSVTQGLFFDTRASAGLGIPGFIHAGLVGGLYYLRVDPAKPDWINPDPGHVNDGGFEWGMFGCIGDAFDVDTPFGATFEYVFQGDMSEIAVHGFYGPFGVRYATHYKDDVVMWSIGATVNLFYAIYGND